MDYELEYKGEEYYIGHDNNEVTVYQDGCETTLFSLRWFDGALPEKIASALIDAYRQGYRAGESMGYWRCQYDVKKVLGL